MWFWVPLRQPWPRRRKKLWYAGEVDIRVAVDRDSGNYSFLPSLAGGAR